MILNLNSLEMHPEIRVLNLFLKHKDLGIKLDLPAAVLRRVRDLNFDIPILAN